MPANTPQKPKGLSSRAPCAKASAVVAVSRAAAVAAEGTADGLVVPVLVQAESKSMSVSVSVKNRVSLNDRTPYLFGKNRSYSRAKICKKKFCKVWRFLPHRFYSKSRFLRGEENERNERTFGMRC